MISVHARSHQETVRSSSIFFCSSVGGRICERIALWRVEQAIERVSPEGWRGRERNVYH
ncbi:hypothetical protein Mapa_003788 [Marchantia paleacea]|nr:hypothetical protein Mapa_003788 [Marchantia paleacea]